MKEVLEVEKEAALYEAGGPGEGSPMTADHGIAEEVRNGVGSVDIEITPL